LAPPPGSKGPISLEQEAALRQAVDVEGRGGGLRLVNE
jgi:hypothetical protein